MCSIAGSYSHEEVDEMLKTMEHRSPDGWETWDSTKFTLGAGSLVITDTVNPHKCPYTYEYLTLVFNGEIYNHQEIRHDLENEGYHFDTDSDTEVVIKAFHKYGTKAFEKFDGMFALGIYDKRKHRLYLARDAFGEKPLYYREREFAFASEAKALSGGILRPQRPIMFDSLQYCNGSTLYKNIHQLEPGQYLTFNVLDGDIETDYHYKIEEHVKPMQKWTFDETLQCLDNLLEDVVRLRIPTEVGYSLYLSDGVDSNLLNYYIQVVTKKTDNLTFETMDKDKFNSLKDKVVYHLDFPVGSFSSAALYELGRRAKEKGRRVVLSGEGADEVFGGYMRYIPVAYKYQLAQLYPSYHELFEKVETWEMSDEMMYANLVCKSEYSVPNQKSLMARYKELAKQFDPITTMQLFDIKYILPSLLQMGDRMASAHGLENRCPFLSKKIVEFGLSLPYEYKINGVVTKYLLRKLAGSKNIHVEKEKKGLTIPYNKWNNIDDYSRNKYFFEMLTIWRTQNGVL